MATRKHNRFQSLEGRERNLESKLTVSILVALSCQYLSMLYSSIDTPFQVLSICFVLYAFAKAAIRIRFRAFVALYLLLWAALMLFYCIYGSNAYGQSIIDFCRTGYTFVYILLIVPAILLFEKQDGYITFLEKLRNLNTIFCVYLLLAGALFFLTGYSLIEFHGIRNGLGRMSVPYFAALAMLFSVYMIASHKSSGKLDAISVFVFYLALFFVDQGRVSLVMAVSSSLVLIIMSTKGTGGRVAALSALVVIITFGISVGLFDSTLATFDIKNSEYGSSNMTHYSEYEYYWGMFTSNVEHGIGLISVDSPFYILRSGPMRCFYMDDAGIIGGLAGLGIWAIILFVWPLIRCLQTAAEKQTANRNLLIALTVYFILSVASQFLIFPFMRMIWPLSLAMFEYQRWCNQLGETDE